MSRRRAIAWRHAQHDMLCDRVEPWTYGTHVRTSAYPGDVDFNCLRVEHGEPGAYELLDAAERLLGDLAHRKIEVQDHALGEGLRAAVEAAGWDATPCVWLTIEREPDVPAVAHQEVGFEDIRELRAEWVGHTPGESLGDAPVMEEITGRFNCRTLVAHHGGRQAAFVLFSVNPPVGEIWLAFTSPGARGRGLAGGLLAAAVRACLAAGCDHVIVTTDDEGRAKALYERIGFRAVWVMWEFTRRPMDASPSAH